MIKIWNKEMQMECAIKNYRLRVEHKAPTGNLWAN